MLTFLEDQTLSFDQHFQNELQKDGEDDDDDDD